MTIAKLLTGTLLVCVLTVLGTPTTLTAQCGDVLNCNPPSASYHELFDRLPRDLKQGDEGFHQECIECIIEEEVKWTSECHGICEPEFLPEALHPVYGDLLAAVRSGEDVDTVVTLAGRIPAFAGLNFERSSLQVYGCDGLGIVANVRLTEAQLTQAQAQLGAVPLPPALFAQRQ